VRRESRVQEENGHSARKSSSLGEIIHISCGTYIIGLGLAVDVPLPGGQDGVRQRPRVLRHHLLAQRGGHAQGKTR
jgi:hypothetical protein